MSEILRRDISSKIKQQVYFCNLLVAKVNRSLENYTFEVSYFLSSLMIQCSSTGRYFHSSNCKSQLFYYDLAMFQFQEKQLTKSSASKLQRRTCFACSFFSSFRRREHLDFNFASKRVSHNLHSQQSYSFRSTETGPFT